MQRPMTIIQLRRGFLFTRVLSVNGISQRSIAKGGSYMFAECQRSPWRGEGDESNNVSEHVSSNALSRSWLGKISEHQTKDGAQ